MEGRSIAGRPPKSALSGIGYLRRSLFGSTHLFFLAVVVLLAALAGGWTFALGTAVTELLVVGLFSTSGIYRRRVDREIQRAEIADAKQRRSQWLRQMSTSHKTAFGMLEELTLRVRGSCGTSTHEVSALFDQHLGLSPLTLLYVRMAIQHRRTSESIAGIDEFSLREDLQRMRALANHRSPRVRTIAERRREILERRLSLLEQTRDDLTATEQLLATIDDFIRLTLEQCTTEVDFDLISQQIEEFSRSLEVSKPWLSELAAPLVDEDADRRTLELARSRLTQPGEEPWLTGDEPSGAWRVMEARATSLSEAGSPTT
jgi:hypothetical protein